VETIRDEQVDAFRQAKQEAFVERAIAFARQAFPKETAPYGDEQMSAAVEIASDRAFGYGLRSELDHIRYLGLMFSLGPEFDSQEEWKWIREILDDQDLKPEEKMPAILEKGRQQ